MSRHKTVYVISWNFMSWHVVCHDYSSVRNSMLRLALMHLSMLNPTSSVWDWVGHYWGIWCKIKSLSNNSVYQLVSGEQTLQPCIYLFIEHHYNWQYSSGMIYFVWMSGGFDSKSQPQGREFDYMAGQVSTIFCTWGRA